MAQRISASHWLILTLVGFGVAIGGWLALAPAPEPPDANPDAAAGSVARASGGSTPPSGGLDGQPGTRTNPPEPALPTSERGPSEVALASELDSGMLPRADEMTKQVAGGQGPSVEIATSNGRTDKSGSDDALAIPEESDAASDVPSAPSAPAQRIAEGGRLSVDAASLRDGEVLALGLALSDEARGSEPLPVRIVSVDGRRIETTAVPAEGDGSGLRLELDPEWLEPGRYLIEISTTEKIHLPLRRYVLEVP